MSIQHPYFPPDLEIRNYVPNAQPMTVLLSCVAVGVVGWLTTAYWIAGTSPHMKPGRDRAIFCWFALCALTHCSFEAYWVWFNKTVASRTDIPAELLREYANADSRYMTSDPLVLTLETLTVVGLLKKCELFSHIFNFHSLARLLLVLCVFWLWSQSITTLRHDTFTS